MSRIACWVMLCVVALPGVCLAAGVLEKVRQEAEEAKVVPVVVRMYNVQDLMLGRDHPYDSGMVPATEAGGDAVWMVARAAGGGGAFGDLFGAGEAIGDEAAMTSALSPQALEDILLRAIEAEPWADEGGRGRIERVGALFVITQTEDGHKQIKDLIEQFRQARKMLTIRAKWLLVDPKQLPLFLPAGANASRAPQVVDLAPLGNIEVDARVIFEGQVTCFDRQATHLASGAVEVFCSDIEPVVAENAVGWDPTMIPLFFGVLVEVTPSLAQDRREATLDVKSTFTEKAGEAQALTIEAATDKGTAKAQIDKPRYFGHTFRTTLRLPLDKPVLVGGLTSPEPVQGKVIYLIMEVSSSQDDGAPEAASPAKKK